MADNQVNIPLKLKLEHKAQLDILKADIRKTMELIKTEGKKSIAEIQANNKLEVQESKNKTALKIAQMRQETSARNQELRKQREEQRKADKQAIEDAKLLSRVRARELQNAFPKDKKGMSLFQGMEFGENLTVVSAGITAAIYAITQATQKLFSIAKQGTEYGVLKENFEQMSGGAENARKNIDLLYKAVAGNIDKAELMGISNEYKFLGINIEEVAKLLDGIESRGDAVKIGFREALDAVNKYIMSGMQRGLLQGLKFNVADVKKEFDALVFASGKSKEMLSDEEAQSIRLQVALNLLGTEAKTTSDILNKSFDNADKLAAIETKYKNIKDELSLIASRNVVSYIDSLNEKLENSSLALEGNETAISKTADAYKTFVNIVETFAPVSVLSNLSLEFNKAFINIKKGIDDGTVSFDTFISSLNVNPNTSWVSPIVGGLKTIYSAAKDAYNAIFQVKNTSVNTGVTDLDTRVNNAVNSIQERTKNYVGFYEYQTLPNPMPLETRGGKSGNSGNSGKVKTEKEILDAYNKQLEVISKIKDELILNANLTGKVLQLNADLIKAYQELRFIQSGTNLKELGIIGNDDTNPNRNLSSFTGGTSFIQSKGIDVLIAQFTEPFMDLTGNIKNVFSDLMNVLDADAESFVGKMVNGFDKVLSIVNMIVNTMNTINAVKGLISTITSIIPGGGLIAAVGGLSGGGGMISPMLSGGNSRPIVNVVVHSEVEKTKAIEFFDNNFNAYQNYVRENSH